MTQPKSASAQSAASATSKAGRARGVSLVLLLAVFGGGVALGLAWAHRPHSQSQPEGPAQLTLSDASRAALQHLSEPVEVRFYSQLDPSPALEATRAFAARVDALLTTFEAESGGRLHVRRVASGAQFDFKAAVADGIKPFNQDKGDPCFLGLVVVKKDQSETLPRLDPAWEQAVELDLGRILGREPAPSATAAPQEKIDPAAIMAVKQTLTNLDTVSVDDGNQILRGNALEEFRKAARDMETELKTAEQDVLVAQQKGTTADQQSAQQKLAEVRARQMEILKDIAARSKAQTDALQHLKQKTPQP